MAEEQLGDRTVGVQKSEEILPVGTVLTAVGELRSVVGHPDAFKVRRNQQSARLCCRRRAQQAV